MDFGLDVATTANYADPYGLTELAADAEAAGWDGFFVLDVLLGAGEGASEPVADPWIALAAIAATTRRIKSAPFMTPLPRCRPWQVARAVVSLDHLSKGRVIFGAGLGYRLDEFVVLGEDPDPRVRAAKLDEELERSGCAGEARQP